jgi:hypothetical protein
LSLCTLNKQLRILVWRPHSDMRLRRWDCWHNNIHNYPSSTTSGIWWTLRWCWWVTFIPFTSINE